MSFITQRGATAPLAVQANGSFQTSTDVNLASLTGTRWDTSDGRELILVSVGTTAIASSGFLVQDSPLVANHVGLTVTAVQAYSANGNIPATVTVTIGATALAANQYQGGFLQVNTGSGNGQNLKVASNAAALASGTGVVITLEDGPNTALNTDSVVSLIPNEGSGIVICPTTLTNAPRGVTLYPMAAGSYGFLTARGPVAVYSDVTAPGVGLDVVASSATAGTIRTNNGSSVTVGYTMQAATSGSAKAVYLQL